MEVAAPVESPASDAAAQITLPILRRFRQEIQELP